jgi:hypothetical protein
VAREALRIPETGWLEVGSGREARELLELGAQKWTGRAVVETWPGLESCQGQHGIVGVGLSGLNCTVRVRNQPGPGPELIKERSATKTRRAGARSSGTVTRPQQRGVKGGKAET